MKKILIAGLLAVSSTGALFATPIFAADDDRRIDQREHRRDNNDSPDRSRRPDRDGDRNRDHDRDHDRDDRDRDYRDGNRDRDRDRNDSDHRWNNRPDWNGPRPGNGVPPRNGGYVPPRPLPNSGYGNGRPGDGYGRPGNGDYNGNYSGGYNGNYNEGYNGYNSQNLETIAKRIESALRNDRQLSRYKLGTDTVRGTIELEGSVRSNSERQRAVSIARDIARGVQINATRLQVRY